MGRTRDMLGALRFAVVWLLLLVIPLGGGRFEIDQHSDDSEACESWCPCDEGGHGEADTPCDEDCEQGCSDCCDARVVLAVVGVVQLPTTQLRGAPTTATAPPDAPGHGVCIGVFRPPPASLT